MTTEYIFFDPELHDRFVQELGQRGLACSSRADDIEGSVVALTTEPDDAVLEELESVYETLMQEQMLRAEDRDDWGSHQVASLQIDRADGSTAEVRLPPAVARTLLERYSIDEARELVTAIAHSLESPQGGPLCRRELFKPR